MPPILCPFCGTYYTAFQSNCKNCGGPIPLPPAEAEAPEQVRLTLPPPPPRPIADSYVWKLLSADGWATASGIFILIGVIFAVTGLALTAGIITAFVGIPFAILGLLFAGGGAAVLYSRYSQAQKTVQVLRLGEAVQGQITEVSENINVSVNNNHPWTIRYAFQAGGADYQGQVTTLRRPAPNLQPDLPAVVLYLPSAPLYNALYPHP